MWQILFISAIAGFVYLAIHLLKSNDKPVETTGQPSSCDDDDRDEAQELDNESPWNVVPYANAFDGFLAEWDLMTLLDPVPSFEKLMYLGYAGDPVDHKKQHFDRNVFQCFVFGPKEAGKSSLLQSFVGSSNEASWLTATELLVQVANHTESTGYEVPFVIVAGKYDLEPYPTAIHDVTRVSQDMEIEAHIPINTKLGDFNDIYWRFVGVANHPRSSIPETEAGNTRKLYDRLLNHSLMVISGCKKKEYMEKVYEELDDAKAEIEKLRLECRAKADLCDDLKRSNADQVKKIQELNQKLEKQDQEVEAKADEVFDTKQSLEELECRHKEMESVVKSLTSTNTKLQADFDSKLQESEEEKQRLFSSLEVANVKMSDLKQQNRAFMDKIEFLKGGIVSVLQKRGYVWKSGGRKSEARGAAKWKNEELQHLEEAHKKLRDNLKAKEKDWDMEKCTFVDHISAMETKLDSQSKISEGYRRRLQTCSEALTCEENQRKGLDIQLLELEEMKSRLVMLTNEKESACKEMECKIVKLGEENQELVSSLKESQIREASNSSSIIKLQEHIKSLEHNHNVRESEWSSRFEKLVADFNSCKLDLASKEVHLKDTMKESDACNSQVLQLRTEIKSLEQILNIKESEWSSQLEKLIEDLITCRFELESKDASLDELMTELDDYNSQVLQLTKEKEESALMMKAMKSAADVDLNSCRLELQSKEARLKKITRELNDYNSQVLQLTKEKEESAVMMVAMRSTLMEARSNIDKEKLLVHKEIESHKMKLLQTESELMHVCNLLENEQARLKQITRELNDCNSQVLQLTMEKEESSITMLALKSTLTEARSNIDEGKILLHKELDSHKKQLLQTTSELENACDLLDKANEELAHSYCEVNEVKIELQIWKSVAEELEVHLETSRQMRREIEASLLAQVVTEVNLKEENSSLVCTVKEREKTITDLEQKIKEVKQNMHLQLAKKNGDDLEKWEKDCVTQEREDAILAQLEYAKIDEHEKQSINQVVEEKDQRIVNLREIMRSLEKGLDHRIEVQPWLSRRLNSKREVL